MEKMTPIAKQLEKLYKNENVSFEDLYSHAYYKTFEYEMNRVKELLNEPKNETNDDHQYI